MEQREKLVNLIIESVRGCARNWAEVIADHLLANGVIVPPCKVGDALWFPSRYHDRPIPFVITRLEFYDEELVMCCEGSIEWKCESIGKTVFLTLEEAEKALAETTDKNLQE